MTTTETENERGAIKELETKCLHLPHDEERRRYDATFGAISYPIFQTAAFEHPGVRADYQPGQDHISLSSGHNYTRESNPTRDQLEKLIAQLENGETALAMSSGMAAITLLLNHFRSGDQIIVDSDLYGGSIRLFAEYGERYGIKFTRCDLTKDDPSAVATDRFKAIYFETPTNPMTHVVDIEKYAKFAHDRGALCVVDNTFLSPYFQNPLDWGADVVVHSGTKFLSGHHDTIAGFLVVRDRALGDELKLLSTTVGSALAPFDAWLVLRGVRTLSVRLDRAQENAFKIVEALQKQPHVTRVFYPGIESSPGYAIMKKQARGFGAMISFETDTKERAISTLTKVKTIVFAESLGGVESLITYPIAQTHASVPPDVLDANGLTDRILRLSVGIEGASDLIADLDQALNS